MVNANRSKGPPSPPPISSVYGVDFSGASKPGKTAWLAEFDVVPGVDQLRLRDLNPLEKLAGEDDREVICRYFVDRIQSSDACLWGMDFPFGLPIELEMNGWHGQLRCLDRFEGTAKEFGRHLVERSRRKCAVTHIRRQTDRESKTPFDCYHYRIIYQTFHGMRDVLNPLVDDSTTAILPFEYQQLAGASRVVVEACPSSTLKRLGLPHQKYKQSAGKPPEPNHVKTRREILRGISSLATMTEYRKQIMMQNSGGDAIDAVLAGVGCYHAVRSADHQAIANSERYPHEGYVYF